MLSTRVPLFPPQVPLVACAFMTSRRAAAYAEIFKTLKREAPAFQPTSYMGDFDGAMRSAIRQLFPNIRIHGCLFHYAQCIVRKASDHDVGLSSDIRRTGPILKKFLAFGSLPLLPPDRIDEVFEQCATEALDISPRVGFFPHDFIETHPKDEFPFRRLPNTHPMSFALIIGRYQLSLTSSSSRLLTTSAVSGSTA